MTGDSDPCERAPVDVSDVSARDHSLAVRSYAETARFDGGLTR